MLVSHLAGVGTADQAGPRSPPFSDALAAGRRRRCPLVRLAVVPRPRRHAPQRPDPRRGEHRPDRGSPLAGPYAPAAGQVLDNGKPPAAKREPRWARRMRPGRGPAVTDRYLDPSVHEHPGHLQHRTRQRASVPNGVAQQLAHHKRRIAGRRIHDACFAQVSREVPPGSPEAGWRVWEQDHARRSHLPGARPAGQPDTGRTCPGAMPRKLGSASRESPLASVSQLATLRAETHPFRYGGEDAERRYPPVRLG